MSIDLYPAPSPALSGRAERPAPAAAAPEAVSPGAEREGAQPSALPFLLVLLLFLLSPLFYDLSSWLWRLAGIR